MILIKNVEVYNPKYLGVKDILLCGENIEIIDDNIEIKHEKIKIIDGSKKKLLPGFIDQHVHITGGGGEGSFKSRVPEITLSKFIEGGVTTVVGLLGTDGVTRSVENLVAKAKALKEEGISVYTHTGSYGVPSVTLTGSVEKDIVFIDEIIGVKVALSDHRSSQVTFEELARLASEARVAGMVSGKAGIVVAHMGDGKQGLSLIKRVVEETDIPAKVIRPTHVCRKEELLKEAFEYAKMGGIIDLTCSSSKTVNPRRVIARAKEENVPMENITISSDGYGSWSKYDERGNLLKMGYSLVDGLYKEFKDMVQEKYLSIEEALTFITSNVAKALELYPKKGAVEEGSDADLLLVNSDLELDMVIARGKVLMENGVIKKYGTYE